MSRRPIACALAKKSSASLDISELAEAAEGTVAIVFVDTVEAVTLEVREGEGSWEPDAAGAAEDADNGETAFEDPIGADKRARLPGRVDERGFKGAEADVAEVSVAS